MNSYGYSGRVIRIDLTTKDISFEPITDYAHEWIGGNGIDQWILYKEVKRQISPYSPSNRLTFGAGPLVGTLAPGASRMSASSKNPFTMGIGTSNCGGYFGVELKYAGYDHLIFQGRSKKPVYLWIKDDHVELKDATHLWGKTIWQTVDAIRQELGDSRIHILSIGPGGENLVRGASIIQDKDRAFGRCGLGGVMGSKNLKAIAVRGNKSVKIAYPEKFIRAVDELRKHFENSTTVDNLMKLGTPAGLRNKQASCGIPYKNFQYLVLPEDALAKMDQEAIQKYRVRNIGHPACPIPCSRYFSIDDGPYAGLNTEGYQLEAPINFAGKLAVSDPIAVIKINSYCNELGLDIDMISGAIGWAMECYQRGILKNSDTDGIQLDWGDVGIILELIRKIAYREGFGDILAEGCARAAEIIGRNSDYYAMHMKGQDLYEVIRNDIGWGLGVCSATRGGTHTTGAPGLGMKLTLADPVLARKIHDKPVISTAPIDYKDKAIAVFYTERLHRMNNAMGICHIASTWEDPFFVGFPEMAELYSTATGRETTEADLLKMSARMLNAEKAFNLLNTNLERKDDYPPKRELEEQVPTGSLKGWRLEKEKWGMLLDEYYEMNQWDRKTGFPTRECLKNLDLIQVADDLEKVNKLGR